MARPHHRQRLPLVALAMKGLPSLVTPLVTPVVGLVRGSLAVLADG